MKRRIIRKEPENILVKLNYTIKAEEIKLDQNPIKIPIEIKKQIPRFMEDNVVGVMINEEIASQWQKYMQLWYGYSREKYPEEDDMVYDEPKIPIKSLILR